MATFDLSKLPQLLSHGTVCKGDWLCTKLSITMCKWQRENLEDTTYKS